jgi:hypothetical protein
MLTQQSLDALLRLVVDDGDDERDTAEWRLPGIRV